MSKLYDIAVLGGDDPGSWLVAAAFAVRDLRVALILDRSPDPETATFPWLPFDLSRHEPLMSAAGLVPVSAPAPGFVPDFQVIVKGKAVDVTADPVFFQRGLDRDLGPDAGILLGLSTRLEREAQEFLSQQAASETFLPFNRSPAAERPWKKWFKKKNDAPAPPRQDDFISDAPPQISAVFRAAARAALGAPLGAGAPLTQTALLWLGCRSLKRGTGSDLDLREQAAARIAKRGAVLEALPDAVIAEGRILHSIRMKNRAIVDTRVLVGNALTLRDLFDPGKSRDQSGDREERTLRTTFFYRLEKSAVPEALADRAVVVTDPGEELSGYNLMTLTRSPRVPKRQTLAITMTGNDELDPETAPVKLASTLPWLDPEAFSIDETRKPLTVPVPSGGFGLAPPPLPNFPMENVFALPSDVLPGWGPAGLEHGLRALLSLGEELLKKYKARSG